MTAATDQRLQRIEEKLGELKPNGKKATIIQIAAIAIAGGVALGSVWSQLDGRIDCVEQAHLLHAGEYREHVAVSCRDMEEMTQARKRLDVLDRTLDDRIDKLERRLDGIDQKLQLLVSRGNP